MAAILHLVDLLSGRSGGAEIVVENVAVRLAEAGHHVTVVTTRVANGPPLEALSRAGVRHVHVARRGRIGIRGLIRLAKVVSGEKTDVLHAHKFGSNVWGTLLGRALGVPVVIAHEQTWNHKGQRVRRGFDHLIGRLVDVFISVSQADAEFMRSVERIPPEKVVVLPNPHFSRREVAVEPPIRLPKPHGPLAAAVLVMRRQKRVDNLVRAFAVASERVPDATLMLVGDGSERGVAERLAVELGVADRVHFLGYRRNVRPVWELADVAVLASDYEGTPLAILEAMSCGVPAVATSVGGVPDIVKDDLNGVLVAPSDPQLLGTALADLLSDEPRRARLAEGARATAAQYDGEAYVRSIDDLYRALLESASRRPERSRSWVGVRRNDRE